MHFFFPSTRALSKGAYKNTSFSSFEHSVWIVGHILERTNFTGFPSVIFLSFLSYFKPIMLVKVKQVGKEHYIRALRDFSYFFIFPKNIRHEKPGCYSLTNKFRGKAAFKSSFYLFSIFPYFFSFQKRHP